MFIKLIGSLFGWNVFETREIPRLTEQWSKTQNTTLSVAVTMLVAGLSRHTATQQTPSESVNAFQSVETLNRRAKRTVDGAVGMKRVSQYRFQKVI